MTPAERVEALLALSPSKRRRALARLDNDTLVDVLAITADTIDAAAKREAEGYKLRLAIFQAARDRPEKVTQKRLADAARVSEPAVIQALKKDRLAQAG